ncbi:MAG: hypothetical protein IPL61_22795 [Myxococcales bacterium]|nr:hypothetical protein [Myxococcales bacterium]
MTARLAATVLALVAVVGCASYRGGARPIDPVRIRADAGWIAAAPTPEVRQRGELDCGAAALAMVAGRWRVPLTEHDAIAALPAPSPTGTRLGDLRDAARAEGLSAFAIAGDRDTLVHELRAGRPVIIGLHLSYGRQTVGHYEVLVAVHPIDDRFVTIDPASGWRVRRWVDLDAEWAPAGRPTLVVIGSIAPVAVRARADRRVGRARD